MRERRGWIEGSAASLRVGCVKFYRTHEEHTDWRGRTFPVGSQCFAGRLPTGGVFLLFLTLGNPPDDPASVVFLPRGYGLCGIEPHVLDPRKTNHLMADLAAQQACRDAFDLFARWEEQAVEERNDREPEVRLERMHSQIEKQVDGIGRDLEAHAERMQAAIGRSIGELKDRELDARTEKMMGAIEREIDVLEKDLAGEAEKGPSDG